MNASHTLTVTGLELRQRVRSVAWYVLLAVFAATLLVVTAFASFVWAPTGEASSGAGIYSTIVFFTLLLIALVSPALSGNAINGDRESATLAGLQVTLATTADIVIGKFLAAWITGLAFLVVAVPFLLYACITGIVSPAVVLSSLAVLIAESAVFAAIGVGLSGLIARGLFSVVASYLVVALFTIGTLLFFGLGGMAVQTPQTQQWRTVDDTGTCLPWEETETTVPRFDLVWGILALNPFVVIGDAVPAHYSAEGYPDDAFTGVQYLIRSAQVAPESVQRSDGCSDVFEPQPTPRELVAHAVPSWYVGLGAHLVIGAGLLFWATRRTNTPARRLPPGTRIA